MILNMLNDYPQFPVLYHFFGCELIFNAHIAIHRSDQHHTTFISLVQSVSSRAASVVVQYRLYSLWIIYLFYW